MNPIAYAHEGQAVHPMSYKNNKKRLPGASPTGEWLDDPYSAEVALPHFLQFAHDTAAERQHTDNKDEAHNDVNIVAQLAA